MFKILIPIIKAFTSSGRTIAGEDCQRLSLVRICISPVMVVIDSD